MSESLSPGTKVLFYWFDDEANRTRVLEGSIKRLEDNKYIIEDSDFSYIIPIEDVIRMLL